MTSIQERTTTNINTGSTGGLGFAYRSYERGYLNYPNGVVTDPAVIRRLARIGTELVRRRRRGMMRSVARMLVSEEVLDQVLEATETRILLEAAVPLSVPMRSNGHRGRPLWMILGAVNHASRKPLYPVEVMTDSVDAARTNPSEAPAARIARVRREGFRFLEDIPTERREEIRKLWGDSFEWDGDGVRKLQEDLDRNRSLPPSSRSVWFTGVVDPATDRLAALATAERLDMPLGNGTVVPVVENTEWRRSDATGRHGLVAAAVSHLNAQILEDLDGLYPAIIAETNFRSGAHHVGFAAGMDVAPRQINGRAISQMLVQNVRVGDGFLPDGPRDFTMMYLPEAGIQSMYSRDSRRSMLKGGA